jgi:hypothetical protein
MMRRMICAIIACLLLAALLAIPGPAAAGTEAAAIVRILPAKGTYREGESIAVQVKIENVSNLYGADVQLAFDPADLQVVDADPNTTGVQITPRDELLSPDFVLKNEANNKKGTVWYAATQVNPTPPASGSGVLFEFTFLVTGDGETTVILQQQLADRYGQRIPGVGRNATYTIIGKQYFYFPVILKASGGG